MTLLEAAHKVIDLARKVHDYQEGQTAKAVMTPLRSWGF